MLAAFGFVALLTSQSAVAPSAELQRGLFGTVLLVTTLDKGLASYGSGVVLNKEGLILTNLHVLDGARAVYALPYDPDKPSYTAVDGGLDRLVFERQKDLVAVSVIRGDPVLDLAVVRLEGPTSVGLIPIAQTEPAVGEPVVAIGHPEQNFWTITRGQISAKPSGMLQHDAAINKGNSGGPLLNNKGELVGINTLFQKDTQGLFFARPIALANKLVAVVTAPLIMDRSTPEKAVMVCARARELGDPAFAQCIHWGSHYETFLFARRMLIAQLVQDGSDLRKMYPSAAGGPKTHAVGIINAWLNTGDGRAEVWVKHYGPLVMTWALNDDPVATGAELDRFITYVSDGTRGGKPAKHPDRADIRGYSSAQARSEVARVLSSDAHDTHNTVALEFSSKTGLKVPTTDVAALRRVLKMGLRVEKTALVGTDYAWVAVGGRNLDGSPYHYSALLRHEADGWKESIPTFEVIAPDLAQSKNRIDRLANPPEGFPPAFDMTQMVLFMGAVMGAMSLAQATLTDPVDGISQDFAFELMWPVMMDMMRTDGRLSFDATLKQLSALNDDDRGAKASAKQ